MEYAYGMTDREMAVRYFGSLNIWPTNLQMALALEAFVVAGESPVAYQGWSFTTGNVVHVRNGAYMDIEEPRILGGTTGGAINGELMLLTRLPGIDPRARVMLARAQALA